MYGMRGRPRRHHSWIQAGNGDAQRTKHDGRILFRPLEESVERYVVAVLKLCNSLVRESVGLTSFDSEEMLLMGYLS